MDTPDQLSLRRYGASPGSHSHDHFQILLGLQGSRNVFSECPSYQAIAELSFEERVARLKDPALRERLLRGTPVLRTEDDVFTNHIHADDLARACVLALWRGQPQRNVNVSDDTDLKMGDYFDLAADLYGLSRPPRIARNAAGDQLPLMLLSFMSESRRLHNQRMKTELGLRLRYPTVAEGLRA